MKKDSTANLFRFTARLVLFAIAASLILPVALASGQTPPYVAGNAQGIFVVENALAQFVALKHHGEALAWIKSEADGAPIQAYMTTTRASPATPATVLRCST